MVRSRADRVRERRYRITKKPGVMARVISHAYTTLPNTLSFLMETKKNFEFASQRTHAARELFHGIYNKTSLKVLSSHWNLPKQTLSSI